MFKQPKVWSALLFLVGAVFLMAAQSCTRGVALQRSEYSQSGSLERGAYRIHTAERVISTDRVEIAADKFVVSALFVDGRRKFVEPFGVPFDDVTKFEHVVIHRGKTTALLVPLTIGVGAATLFIMWAGVIPGT